MTVTTALDFFALAVSAIAFWECIRTRRLIRKSREQIDETLRMLDRMGATGPRVLFQSPDFPPGPRLQRRPK